MKMLVIRDIKANCYPFAPMCVHHVGGAIRDFQDQCQDKNTQLGKHPADYELYEIGEWDDVTGEITLHQKKKQLAVGTNFTV